MNEWVGDRQPGGCEWGLGIGGVYWGYEWGELESSARIVCATDFRHRMWRLGDCQKVDCDLHGRAWGLGSRHPSP